MKRVPERWAGCERGIASVEFAIIAPLLVALVVGICDVGLGIYRKMQVQTAAQIGAQTAATTGFDTTAISNAVKTATSNAQISASPAATNYCGCPSSTGVSTVSCAIPTCSSGVSPGSYVTVNAQYTYVSIVKLTTLQFNASSTVRIR